MKAFDKCDKCGKRRKAFIYWNNEPVCRKCCKQWKENILKDKMLSIQAHKKIQNLKHS